MGWTYTHKSKNMSIKEFFEQEFPSMDILECSVVKFRTVYMACRSKSKPEEVFAVICLINYAPKDHYNFGYKDMDETMGPCERSAPEKIMKLLTPIEVTGENSRKWATEWREACWKRINAMKAKAKTRKADPVKVGDVIEFEHSIRFTDGREQARFKVERVKPFRVKAIAIEGFTGYGTYRPGRQETNPFTIVAKALARPGGLGMRDSTI